jgi:hypothetical protein
VTTPTGSRTSAGRTRKAAAPGTSGRGAGAARSTNKGAAAKPAAGRKGSARQGAGGTPAGAAADSPILPVEQLEALRKIKPDAVDWVIAQTQAEAEHRRMEMVRVNNLIFVEHLFAQVSALIIGVAGVWGGVWLAQNGQPWVGFAIAAVVMAALAVVQLGARAKRQ